MKVYRLRSTPNFPNQIMLLLYLTLQSLSRKSGLEILRMQREEKVYVTKTEPHIYFER